METKVDFVGNLHPNISEPESRPRDPQRWAFAINAPRPSNGYSVHNDSLNNLLRGLNERVFYTDNNRTPPVAPKAFAFSALDSVVPLLKPFQITPLTLEGVRDSYAGNRSQFNRYTRALNSLAVQPLSSRDFKVSTFVKCEKINFAAKNDPAPRVIQPRDPRFNLTIGQYIKPLEPIFYKQLKKLYKFPCVAKGFDVYQQGDIMKSKWDLFKNPVAIGMDASRFDQHVSVDALKWTHSVYRQFCSDPEFSYLLDAMLLNKGHGSCKDGFVKYWVEGRRMSGDMDTALGNCVLMVCMTYALCQNLNIKHEVMDNGDDLVIIMNRDDEAKFRPAVDSWFSSLGFKMKVEPSVYVLEHIEFCQMHPVFDGVNWRMVRNPMCLAKDLVCCTGQTQVSAWLQALGMGGLSLCAGLPVYQEFYSWLTRFGHKTRRSKAHLSRLYLNSGFLRMAKPCWSSDRVVVSVEARESFALAFNIPFCQQLSLESMYGELSTGPLDINHVAHNCISEFSFHSPEFFQTCSI